MESLKALFNSIKEVKIWKEIFKKKYKDYSKKY